MICLALYFFTYNSLYHPFVHSVVYTFLIFHSDIWFCELLSCPICFVLDIFVQSLFIYEVYFAIIFMLCVFIFVGIFADYMYLFHCACMSCQ